VSEPQGTAGAEPTQRLVADLGSAFQARSVYAPGHPQVTAALARVIATTTALWEHAAAEEVTILLLEGQLVVERQAIPENAPWARGLLRGFQRHGLRGLTLVAGLDEAELGRFLDGCQGSQGPSASRHILIGQAGYAAENAPEVAAGPVAAPSRTQGAVSAEQVEAAAAELRAVSTGEKARVDQLRRLIAQLVRGVEADALRSASASVDDREFLHGLAVAFATLRLARALGVKGDALEDLALAGLLHDVGYLEGTHEEDPVARRRLHPSRGAARLAALEGIPDVAVLVAFEHHLRVDGKPNYPSMAAPRRPVAAARIVAVADTWETLRSQGESRPEEALEILQGRAGTFLDPALVELFVDILTSGGNALGEA
jgi:HD superfamily phosphohydrolase YqeK